jgi:hypothetical protein
LPVSKKVVRNWIQNKWPERELMLAIAHDCLLQYHLYRETFVTIRISGPLTLLKLRTVRQVLQQSSMPASRESKECLDRSFIASNGS